MQLALAEADAIAAEDCARTVPGSRQAPAAVRRLVRRHRHALPDFDGDEIAEDARGAADVVGIAVADAHVVQPANAERPERRRDDAAADVEACSCDATGIDAQRAPVGKLHDGGIALPDIQERHAQRSRGRVAVAMAGAVTIHQPQTHRHTSRQTPR